MSGLTLKQANTIIEGAIAKAHEMKIKPLAVVVLDAAATSCRRSVKTTRACSAWTWRSAKRGARWPWAARAARWASAPRTIRISFCRLASTANGKFLPQTGAALIKDAAGNILGAAGASGGTGDEDEACCAAGVEKAGLNADVAA